MTLIYRSTRGRRISTERSPRTVVKKWPHDVWRKDDPSPVAEPGYRSSCAERGMPNLVEQSTTHNAEHHRAKRREAVDPRTREALRRAMRLRERGKDSVTA